MCGIFGIANFANENIVNQLVEGLKKLEYRGYDSAGIALIIDNNINCFKSQGKISQLENKINSIEKLHANIGIAHTRWATHGEPNEVNAHPHQYDNITVVHNGIIENHQELRTELQEKGYQFASQTDTEVIPVMLSHIMNQQKDIIQAISNLIDILKGSYSFAVLIKNQQKILAVKNGAPLIIGLSNTQYLLSSDVYALAGKCDEVIYLHDGDMVELNLGNYKIYDSKLNLTSREIKNLTLNNQVVDKGSFETFMLKEIFDQPQTIEDCIKNYFDLKNNKSFVPKSSMIFNKNLKQITIIACGTSYYSASLAKYWFESIARINVNVEIASEYRYRDIVFEENNICIFISQSGETKDTLAALEYAKRNQQFIISIVNIVESSIAYHSDIVLPIYAGAEIGVASTKAFTNQLLTLLALIITIAEHKNINFSENLFEAIAQLSQSLKTTIKLAPQIEILTQKLISSTSILYIARGQLYPVILESALKLKELSYIHAEGIAAGELKHGSIALIDENLPTIIYAMSNSADYSKIESNIQEIIARKAQIFLIADNKVINLFKNYLHGFIELPLFNEFIQPFAFTIIGQLLAYYTAKHLDRDIDQPRNLAKSVTVE